ncbi:MAG: ATP-binding protein [Treponema sp.]|jgi:DNA replication protein DnaC|nr:ATP-binding protein [Treponema sp.]
MSDISAVPIGRVSSNWLEEIKNYQLTPEDEEIIKWREKEIKAMRQIENEEQEKTRLINMRIPLRYCGLSLDNYTVASAEQEKVVEFLREYGKRDFKSMENLVIHGPPGTGKTHMICAFIQGCKMKEAQYWKLSDIMRTIRDSYSPRSEESELQFLKRLSQIPILVIDEIGRQTGTKFEGNSIFDLLDDRYDNMLPTILISNLPLEGEESMATYLGRSVMDRINENSLDIPCFWCNYRDHAEITIRAGQL